MEANQDSVMEAQLKRAVRSAWQKLVKSIESEPETLVIESDDARADASEQTVAEIRKWLFKRRHENGDPSD